MPSPQKGSDVLDVVLDVVEVVVSDVVVVVVDVVPDVELDELVVAPPEPPPLTPPVLAPPMLEPPVPEPKTERSTPHPATTGARLAQAKAITIGATRRRGRCGARTKAMGRMVR